MQAQDKKLSTLNVLFLDKNDQKIVNVTFTVNSEMSQSFIPLDLIRSAQILVGDFTIINPDSTTKTLNAFTQNILCTTRDIPNVILRDFVFAASDEYGAILCADFLSLFKYRIADDKIYLIGPR